MSASLRNTPGMFVCGTDTGVGKTLIASAFVHAYRLTGEGAVGMKPVASGCTLQNNRMENEDVMLLSAASQASVSPDEINSYQFIPAIAPHIAAKEAGVVMDLQTILTQYQTLSTRFSPVVVEGAGGFLVPLSDTLSFADVAVALNLPVILVVGMRLGCINHALLTIEAIQQRGLALAGWVANTLSADMPRFHENVATLKQHISAPCLGVVPYQTQPSYQTTSQYLSLL